MDKLSGQAPINLVILITDKSISISAQGQISSQTTPCLITSMTNWWPLMFTVHCLAYNLVEIRQRLSHLAAANCLTVLIGMHCKRFSPWLHIKALSTCRSTVGTLTLNGMASNQIGSNGEGSHVINSFKD